MGVQAAWEIDLWGKFRRFTESADAQLAAVANYDDVLVSLTADLATAYLQLRTLQQQLAVAKSNVAVQEEGLQIATARFRGGTTDQRDVEQAKTILASTKATIPQLEQQIEQTRNAIATLIGRPPGPLDELLTQSKGIPLAPAQVGIGVPADLLRRRPDIRQAEATAAAAECPDRLPEGRPLSRLLADRHLRLRGQQLRAVRAVRHLPEPQQNLRVRPELRLGFPQLRPASRTPSAPRTPPSRKSITLYQNTVLLAQQEVENGLIGFRKQQERAKFLSEAVKAAQRSVDLAFLQYRNGVTDFTTVLTAEQQLLQQQDALAVTAGAIPTNLVAAYRALGGGWQIREDKSFLPPQTVEAMAKRTNWGKLLAYHVKSPPIPVPRPTEFRLPEP